MTIPYAGDAWSPGDPCSEESPIFSDSLCRVVLNSVTFSTSHSGTRHRFAAFPFLQVSSHVEYRVSDRGVAVSRPSTVFVFEDFCTMKVV